MKKHWKVGELAALTGLTIRTLRYYDQIQLFSPSQYTESGHRLYTKSDLAVLQQVLSLKQIGLSLDDIHTVMKNRDKSSATEIMEIQIARITEDIQVQQNLLYELEGVLKAIHSKGIISVEELTKLLRAMKVNREKYFTKEQLDQIKGHYEGMDPKALKQQEKKFNSLLTKIRRHMEQGTPTTDNDVQELASKWNNMMDWAAGGDPEIHKAAEKFHYENPGNALQNGVDAAIYRYLGKALEGK